MAAFRTLAALGALLLMAASVQAQDVPPGSLPVHQRTISLDAPFAPDPHVHRTIAGGDQDVYDHFSRYCLGFVYERGMPDLTIHYRAGGQPLTISATGSQGSRRAQPVTLIVRGPGGAFYCDPTPPPHAQANPPPATITRQVPMNGTYDVWIGRYQPGPPLPVTIRITGAPTHINTAQSPPPPVEPPLRAAELPNYRLTPAYGSVRLTFANNVTRHIMAGGPVGAHNVPVGNCYGWVARAPDFRVHWQGSQNWPLEFTVNSQHRVMLLINDANGGWRCSYGLPSPHIEINDPPRGQYDIWVGTSDEGPLRPSTLTVHQWSPPAPVPPRRRN
ncbi:MAG: hypothetical protein AB7J28_01825 [Hyphomonadaceae bacterium]